MDFKSTVFEAPEIRAIISDSEEKLSALTGMAASGPGAGDEEMADVTRQRQPQRLPQPQSN